MASSIPSMPASTSTTNNRPLSLSSSSAPMNLFNNNLGPEKSQSLNFTTKTGTDKIKNAHHLQHHHHQQLQLQLQQYRPPHEDPSNPINFSAAAKLFSPFANSPFFSQQQHSIAAAGLHYNALSGTAGPPSLRRDRRLRKSSATAFRSVRKPSNDLDHGHNLYGFHEGFMNRLGVGTVGPAFKGHEGQCLESKIPIEKQLNLSSSDKGSPPSSNYEHLKWEDHVSTTVSAIQSLLHNETFVDVTLVCDIEEDDGEPLNMNHVNEAREGEEQEQSQVLIENETKEKNNNKVDKISRSRCNDDATGCKDATEDSHDSSQAEIAIEAENKCTAELKPLKGANTKNSEEKQHVNINASKPKPVHAQFKAHKVILSTCSEYFCRIFSENPCKHPVIVLKDFQPWEVKAILDFMYKGQVTLKAEHLETLVKAAEALQIRGLKEVIEKSQEWKQRKVTSPSPQSSSSGSKHSPKSSAISDDGVEHAEIEDRAADEEEKHVETRAADDEFSDGDGDGESRISKCLRRPRLRRDSSDLGKYSQCKPTNKQLRSHKMKSILKYENDEDVDDDEEYRDGDEDEGNNDNCGEEEDGPSSPKLLNLSIGTGAGEHQLQFSRHYSAHHEGLLLRSSLSTRRNVRRRLSSGGGGEEAIDSPTGENEPQTTGEREQATGDSFPRSLHNHHGQTNPSASPPFPRRKQARPRRRSGDFVAQDLRTTPLSVDGGGDADYSSPYQQHLFPPSHDDSVDPRQQHGSNEVLDFTIGTNNNNNAGAKRDMANERLLPTSSQVNNFLANHFLKTWSSSTSGGSRTDSPTVQSPHHPFMTAPSPLKREVDSEDFLLSPPVDNYHSRPGTPDTSSPPLSDIHKPTLRRRRDRFAHRRRNHNSQRGFHAPTDNDHLGPFRNNIPSPSAYFHALNNGHPPPSHRSHLNSGHSSDPESSINPLGTQSPSTPPKSFSPLGFPLSLSSGAAAGLHHQNASNANSGNPWPGLPLGPPPIFGRHRAQHSAPRGGPPRAWSNADLTEALHNVWNKKMTTSQASRIFGIPYNSLLMYVRGKYGKSLKLDVLKKGLDMAMLEKANNGTNSSSGTTPSGNRSSTPSNNNNNSQTNKSKSHSAVDSPPLSINSLMGGDRGEAQRGECGGGGREHNNIINISTAEGGAAVSQSHTGRDGGSGNNNNSRNDPQDIIPSGFNPFSIFGEYPPPFPFSNAAAAAAALSHILPPPPTVSASATANHLGIGGMSDKQHEKGSKSHASARHHHHHRGSSASDK